MKAKHGHPPLHEIDWPLHYAGFAVLSVAGLLLPIAVERVFQVTVLLALTALIGAGLGRLTEHVLAHARPGREVAWVTTIVPAVAALAGGGLVAVDYASWWMERGGGGSPLNLAAVGLPTLGATVAWVHNLWFVRATLQMTEQGFAATAAVLLAPVLIWVSALAGLLLVSGVACLLSFGSHLLA
ncbi:MAG: hypothetical protein AAGA48_05160 [Myxococcota bacterium]